MSDKALRGNKLTRIGLKQGGAYGPLRGTTAGGVAKAFRGKEGFKESQALQKKLVGPARKTGNIKSEGKVIGSRIAKTGSLKAMGIPKHIRTKSDFSLKQAIKQTKKMPDKKFREDKTYELSTGKFGKIISGKTGKKNYIKALKYYHHRAQPKGKK